MEIIEVCNIWKCECTVNLRLDEKLCPWCKGTGGKFSNASFKQRKFSVHQCILCKGEGKVDWIQAIIQKPNTRSSTGYPLTMIKRIKNIKMRCTGPQNCKKKLVRIWRAREDKKTGPGWIQVY